MTRGDHTNSLGNHLGIWDFLLENKTTHEENINDLLSTFF